MKEETTLVRLPSMVVPETCDVRGFKSAPRKDEAHDVVGPEVGKWWSSSFRGIRIARVGEKAAVPRE